MSVGRPLTEVQITLFVMLVGISDILRMGMVTRMAMGMFGMTVIVPVMVLVAAMVLMVMRMAVMMLMTFDLGFAFGAAAYCTHI